MKEIPLTRGYVTMVDDEDYEFLMQWKWYALVGKQGDVYAMRSSHRINGKRVAVLMHRVLTNALDKKLVDHQDGNSLNNQKYNLRLCTSAENQRNRGSQINNTTGFCGVVRRGKGFLAQIQLNRVKMHLGMHHTAEDAARAYDAAATKLHGEFARLNFPQTQQ